MANIFKNAHAKAVDTSYTTVYAAPSAKTSIILAVSLCNVTTGTITVYVDHRHPKDILRSVAHELIHHAQCCQGEVNNPIDTSAGYAQRDQQLREIEKDAYFRGNITLFRDWEDNRKNNRGRNMMSESKETEVKEEKVEVKEIKKEEKIKTVQPKVKEKVPLKNWYNNQLYNSLMKKFIKT